MNELRHCVTIVLGDHATYCASRAFLHGVAFLLNEEEWRIYQVFCWVALAPYLDFDVLIQGPFAFN